MINKLLNIPYIKYILTFVAGVLLATFVHPSKTITEKEVLKREQELTSSFTKQLEEKQQEILTIKSEHSLNIQTLNSELQSIKESHKEQLTKLVSENQSLKKSSEKVILETKYPDGKIERKIVSKTVIDAESQKVTQIKKEMEKKVEETVERLKKENQEELVKINSQHSIETASLRQELTVTKNKLSEQIEKYKEVEINKRKLSLGFGYRPNTSKIIVAEYDIKGPIFLGTSLDINEFSFMSTAAILGIRL